MVRMNYKKSRRWGWRANEEQDSTGLLGNKAFSFDREKGEKPRGGFCAEGWCGVLHYDKRTTAFATGALGAGANSCSCSGS